MMLLVDDRQPGSEVSADASRSAPAAAALCLGAAAIAAAGCGPQAARGPEPAADAARDTPSAVGKSAAEEDPAASRGTFRGLYVAGPAVRSFTACGATRAAWLTDRTGGRLDEVYRALAARPYQPVFVEFQGYPLPPPPDGLGTEYEGRVSAVALRHAAPGDAAAGCHDDLGGVAVRAFGGEPHWRLDVAESGIALTEADSVRDTVFPYAPPRDDGSAPGRRVYASASEDPDDGAPRRIEVVIEERPCTDPATGAYFSLAAEVRIDGRTLTGCARENWR